MPDFTYREAVLGEVTLKSWAFAKDGEMDIEVWSGDTFVRTITVDIPKPATWV
jgi:hypothetical protein